MAREKLGVRVMLDPSLKASKRRWGQLASSLLDAGFDITDWRMREAMRSFKLFTTEDPARAFDLLSQISMEGGTFRFERPEVDSVLRVTLTNKP